MTKDQIQQRVETTKSLLAVSVALKVIAAKTGISQDGEVAEALTRVTEEINVMFERLAKDMTHG